MFFFNTAAPARVIRQDERAKRVGLQVRARGIGTSCTAQSKNAIFALLRFSNTWVFEKRRSVPRPHRRLPKNEFFSSLLVDQRAQAHPARSDLTKPGVRRVFFFFRPAQVSAPCAERRRRQSQNSRPGS